MILKCSVNGEIITKECREEAQLRDVLYSI